MSVHNFPLGSPCAHHGRDGKYSLLISSNKIETRTLCFLSVGLTGRFQVFVWKAESESRLTKHNINPTQCTQVIVNSIWLLNWIIFHLNLTAFPMLSSIQWSYTDTDIDTSIFISLLPSLMRQKCTSFFRISATANKGSAKWCESSNLRKSQVRKPASYPLAYFRSRQICVQRFVPLLFWIPCDPPPILDQACVVSVSQGV